MHLTLNSQDHNIYIYKEPFVVDPDIIITKKNCPDKCITLDKQERLNNRS